MVAITGQVFSKYIGKMAFQETDFYGMTLPIVKHSYLVMSVHDLPRIFKEAFYLARSGRPGPVVIDIPKDVQIATARYSKPGPIQHKTYRPQVKADKALIESAVEMLAAAERPIFYTGGGVINSGPGASQLLRELARITGAPVTSTLMGLGAFPASSDQWLGMLGMHGTYEANLAMNQADLIIALGSRFDDRVTGRLDAFAPHARKIHIDIDRSSMNKTVRVDLPIVADVGHALEDMVRIWKGRQHPKPDLSDWWRRIEGWRAVKCLDYPEDGNDIMPQRAIQALYEATRDKAPIITTEVGQHQMWAAQHFHFESPNKWLTSGGLGTMGYGLPAAIGAQLGNPNALVIDIAGEASIQMNIQELATATQYRLPVKIFILNNEYMGMVRQWQELTYAGRYAESYSDALPDFVKLGEAYGWKGIRIEGNDALDDGIAAMLAHDGPVIVDCRVAKLANCFPMIPSGAAHTDMILQAAEVSGEMDDEAKALV
jgi:acetolactate synthase-1/2/3 large subunit